MFNVGPSQDVLRRMMPQPDMGGGMDRMPMGGMTDRMPMPQPMPQPMPMEQAPPTGIDVGMGVSPMPPVGNMGGMRPMPMPMPPMGGGGTIGGMPPAGGGMGLKPPMMGRDTATGMPPSTPFGKPPMTGGAPMGGGTMRKMGGLRHPADKFKQKKLGAK